MKKGVLITIAAAVAFIGAVVLSTMGQAKFRVEACMEFNGRTACRTASGPTEVQTQRTAIDNACAQIASGMADSMSCTSGTPKSLRWLSGK